MLMALTGYLGQEISIYLSIVEAVGHMELQARFLTESILLETEPGLT